MRSGKPFRLSLIALAACIAAACIPARALVHSVTDFRQDSSASAADKYHLDDGWGDSLLLLPASFRYTTVKVIKLSDGHYGNGDAASSPFASNMGLYKFKVAYLSWRGVTHDNGTAPPTTEAPKANIVTRIVDLSPDTAAVDDSAKVIAAQENAAAIAPIIYSNGPPAPTYLNFSADGPRYAAYWGSGTPNGPVRRTTWRDSLTGGTYVLPGAPISTGGFGKISSCLFPGSNGIKTMVAYETDFSTKKFQVRWEDVLAGTSVASAAYARPVFPEDFAVAGDSAGNSVAMWREGAELWAVGFDNTHAEVMAPVRIQAVCAYKDTIEHMYRPYAVAAASNGNFIIAYAAVTGAVSDIFVRTLALPFGAQAYALGAAVAVSGGTQFCLFPDLAVTRDRIAVGWFQRSGAGGSARRLMGTILPRAGAGFTLAGRTDIDLAAENIGFAGMSPNWNRYHWFKAGNVAMDGKGNVVAAYDSGTHAKAALIRNTPIYFDSSYFVSRSFTVGNPAIPAFVFDPAADSVAFLPFRPVTTDTAKTLLRLALSPDNSFSGPGSAYQAIPASGTIKSTAGFYRYRADLLTTKTAVPATTNLTSPKLKSLDLEYNIKPATPAIDSIRIGGGALAAYNSAATYRMLPRKDSLTLVCTGFDADDNGMDFRISLGNTLLKAVAGTRTSPGNFAATLTFLPPDTAIAALVLTMNTVDAGGWSSRPVSIGFDYRNVAPSQILTVYRNLGRDSASVYLPSGGGVDTLSPAPGGLIAIQEGDSLGVKIRYADSNDNTVTASWLINSVPLGSVPVAVSDSLSYRFSPDSLAPAIDTLVARAADRETTITFRIPVRSNHTPSVDSVYHDSYRGKDSLWRTGPFDKVKDFAADTGLTLPYGLASVIGAGFSDPDRIAGDSLSVVWRVWRQPAGCARDNFACYTAVDSAHGDALTRVFDLQDRYLTVRVTDVSGAFRERRLALEYPALDTAAAPGFALAVNSLRNDIIFVIGADKKDTTVTAEILSKGTAPLQILSVATQRNDRKWLELKLDWQSGSPPKADSARFAGATNANALSGGKTLILTPDAALDFRFRFFSDSLRGDSVLTDTLVVTTNDFFSPVLKIPFRLVYNDLPAVRVEVPGARGAGPSGGFNASGLPGLLPARSSISMAFTETVRIAQPSKLFRVYSYLDSLKNPAGFAPIPGSYELRRKRAGLGKISAGADSLADTVIFTPKYAKASDSLKLFPRPGFFIYRDVLHIAVSNGITDLAGNGIDLRLNRKSLVPGSLDTVFQAQVDTSRFYVTETEPAAGTKDWNPEGTLRIHFNRKLSKGPPQGNDSITLFSLNALKAADNRSIKVTSAFRPGKTYDFQFLALDDHDSTLVFRTRPLPPALDTVTVVLSGGMLDTSGLSLDGDGDKFPNWLYDRRDTVDSYRFTFLTTDADFYVFPNPYRFSDSRHRDKGTVTFKNLNSLRGFTPGTLLTVRVHTMTGDLVYDSEKSGNQTGPGKTHDTSLDWDLKNDHGSTVGTGVYIYTLMKNGRQLLHKGKVAVVR